METMISISISIDNGSNDSTSLRYNDFAVATVTVKARVKNVMATVAVTDVAATKEIDGFELMMFR